MGGRGGENNRLGGKGGEGGDEQEGLEQSISFGLRSLIPILLPSQILVLDEADRLLDMGFKQQVGVTSLA